MVDVLEEQIQGGDALLQTALDAGPFLIRENAGKKIVGENALGAFVAPVDGEGDALVQERKIGDLLAAAQLVGAQLAQRFVNWR